MNGLCRDCKWWSEFTQERFIEPGYGICDLATNAWFIPPDTKVFVRPQHNAGLVTAPDFGCNQFQTREVEG